MFFSPNPNLLIDAQLCLLIHFSFLTPWKKPAQTESQMKELGTSSYVSFGYSPLTSQWVFPFFAFAAWPAQLYEETLI